MFGELVLERILPVWRAGLPPRLRGRKFTRLVHELRPELVTMIEGKIVRDWAGNLPVVKRRLASTLAARLESGYEERTIRAAVELGTPGAQQLWRDDGDDPALLRSVVESLKQGSLIPEESDYPDIDLTPADDQRTKMRRSVANIAAMKIAEVIEQGAAVDDEMRRILRGYSGWGGLDLDRYAEEFPDSWKKETHGLIDEYYTPTVIADAIADAVCPLLASVASPRGVLTALEPSAGIGRFIDAFDRARCDDRPRLSWSAVELSTSSARLLRHLRPDVDLEQESFEQWISRVGVNLQGEISLVVANPPFGKRGDSKADDPDPEYSSEKNAAWYFLRRGLDILAPQGIGVFLVPSGFLTSPTAATIRRRVLQRHHLAWASRLAGTVFPGVSPRLKVDVLVFRSRGGQLAAVDPDDDVIAEGRYYETFPEHDLSELPSFEGLPVLVERPTCTACVVSRRAWRALPKRRRTPLAVEDARITEKLDAASRSALKVGARVRDYNAAVASGDPSAADSHAEILADLAEIAANLKVLKTLRRLAETENLITAQAIATTISPTGKIDLPEPGPQFSRYNVEPGDVVGLADALYRDRRRLSVAELVQLNAEHGTESSEDDVMQVLFDAGWNLAGPKLRHLVPLRDYITGDVGGRRIELQLKLDSGHDAPAELLPQLLKQRQRLDDALSPSEFSDIRGVSPRQGWIPLELIADWLGDLMAMPRPPVLIRRHGLVQMPGTSYRKLDTQVDGAVVELIGWLNHDLGYFSPDVKPPPFVADFPPGSTAMREPLWESKDPTDKPPMSERRRLWSNYYERKFYAWVKSAPARMTATTAAYNNAFRSFIPREYTSEPLPISRWGDDIELAPHQVAGARRVLANRGGLIAFDVGVGKTFTAIAIIARARQEGWARRPIVVVPQTLLWKWKRDFERCLPDFRVAVIGSRLHRLSKGARVKAATAELSAGTITPDEFEDRLTTSKGDGRKERAAKWRRFQAGHFDVALVSYESLPKTQIRGATLDRYAEQQMSVQRSMELTLRMAQQKPVAKLSQRQKAVKENGARGWVLDLIAGKDEPDDVVFEELGIDLIVVDEAASFKNLHMPAVREGGSPRYMGGAGREGSKRAWAFDIRSWIVRDRTGGAGIVELTATPAKNSPLEIYNMISYIDGDAWSSVGIDDPEQFIDRYLDIEVKEVVTSSFKIERRPAVVGFTNLDELRSIVYRYGEFRKAEEVGIELPTPRVHQCHVEMDAVQKAKYHAFVSSVERALEEGKAQSVLGQLASLSMVALHADADAGYTSKTAHGGEATRQVGGPAVAAWRKRGWTIIRSGETNVTLRRVLPVVDPSSPKFRAVAKRVVAQPSCGHIIFCEPTAPHVWIADVLVEHGIARDRIVALNANVKSSDRVKIAAAFNGDNGEPRYDVLIANSVANEGIDLQTRTCAIHHVDIPWTPADLEQRNGRGFRQGNSFNVLNIYYYLAKGSMDLFRYDLIQGKANWLNDLIAGNPATSNPAAQAEFSPEDILIALSGDPEKTRERLTQRRDEERKRNEARRRSVATGRLVRASSDFEGARTETGEAKRFFAERGEEQLEILRAMDPKIWPYGWLIDVAREKRMFADDAGPPMYEGLVLARPGESPIEIGKFQRQINTFTVRPIGGARWIELAWGTLGPKIDEDDPFAGNAEDMSEDQLEVMLTDAAHLVETHKGAVGKLLRKWRGASDWFRATVWPRVGAGLVLAAAEDETTAIPAIIDGAIALVAGAPPKGAEVLPSTASGYATALALGRPKNLPWGKINEASELWWGRGFPRGLHDEGEEPEDSSPRAPETDPVAPVQDEIAPAVEGAGALLDAVRQIEQEQRQLNWDRSEGEREKIQTMASTPEGYAKLLAAVERLSRFEDPVAAADDFEEDDLRLFVEKYAEQERHGRRNVDAPWTLDEFVRKLRDDLKESVLASAEVTATADGVLSTEPETLRRDENEAWFVIRQEDEGASRRFVDVLVDEFDFLDDEVPIANTDHPENTGAPLSSGDFLFREDLEEEEITTPWETFRKVVTSFTAAPTALHQARTMLIYARELIAAPLCQGEAKKEALRGLRQATRHYYDAVKRLSEGANGAAYANLRRTSRFVAHQAQTLAASCAVGQTSLGLPMAAELDLANVSDAAREEADAPYDLEDRVDAGEEIEEEDDDDTEDEWSPVETPDHWEQRDAANAARARDAARRGNDGDDSDT